MPRLPHKIAVILMMMHTPSRLQPPHTPLLQYLLNRPPKAVSPVLINSLNHQQHTPELK